MRRIIYLWMLCAGLVFAQDITWQGIDFPTDARKTITALESQYGKGAWLESDRHYQGEVMFLGQEAHVELMIQDNFIYKAIFTWQEEVENVLDSKSYWRQFLRELLGNRVTVDLFSGEHVWQQDRAQVKWSQSVSEESRVKKAPTLQGNVTSKGKNRRLYSIDREEYETTNEMELRDVQIGEDEEYQVTIIAHRVELTQQKIEVVEDDTQAKDMEEENLEDTKRD